MALGPRVQLQETRSSGSQRWVHLGGEAPESRPTSHQVIRLTPSPSGWVCAATCLLPGMVVPGLPLGNCPPLSRSTWLRLGSPSASPALHAHTQMRTRTHSCTHMFSHTNPHSHARTPHTSSPQAGLQTWSAEEASPQQLRGLLSPWGAGGLLLDRLGQRVPGAALTGEWGIMRPWMCQPHSPVDRPPHMHLHELGSHLCLLQKPEGSRRHPREESTVPRQLFRAAGPKTPR